MEFLTKIKNSPFMEARFFDNRVFDYLLAFTISLFTWWALSWLFRQLQKWRERHTNDESTTLARYIVGILGGLSWYFFFFISIYLGVKKLHLPPHVDKIFGSITLIAIVFQVISLIANAIEVFFANLPGREGMPAGDKNQSRNIIILLKVFLWIAGSLFVLDNFGVNISTFIAGLGVGGVALALATQTLLGDAFSSFAISLDRPFEIGDFIIVGEMQGTVERIGLKTTRVRSLSGELLVFSNSDLTNSRIKNYKRMYERRVVFATGVVYGTPLAHMKKIPELIKEAVSSTGRVRFDRSHFAAHADYSLNYESVYWVESPDYLAYRDVHQEISFKIHEAFEREGIEMAFPTQTVHVETPSDSPSS